MASLEWAQAELSRFGLNADFTSLESVERLEVQWKETKKEQFLTTHPDHAGEESTACFQEFRVTAKKLDDVIKRLSEKLKRERVLGDIKQNMRNQKLQKREEERRKEEETAAERMRLQRAQTLKEKQVRTGFVVGGSLLSKLLHSPSADQLLAAKFKAWCQQTRHSKITTSLSKQLEQEEKTKLQLMVQLEQEQARTACLERDFQHFAHELSSKLASMGARKKQDWISQLLGTPKPPTIDEFKHILELALDDLKQQRGSLETEKCTLSEEKQVLADKVRELSQDKEALEDQVEGLNADKLRLDQALLHLEANHQEAQSNSANALRKYQQAAVDLRESKEALQRVGAEREELQRQITLFVTETNSVTGTLDHTVEELCKMMDSLQSLTSTTNLRALRTCRGHDSDTCKLNLEILQTEVADGALAGEPADEELEEELEEERMQQLEQAPEPIKEQGGTNSLLPRSTEEKGVQVESTGCLSATEASDVRLADDVCGVVVSWSQSRAGWSGEVEVMELMCQLSVAVHTWVTRRQAGQAVDDGMGGEESKETRPREVVD